jgi:hypothetical protein
MTPTYSDKAREIVQSHSPRPMYRPIDLADKIEALANLAFREGRESAAKVAVERAKILDPSGKVALLEYAHIIRSNSDGGGNG